MTTASIGKLVDAVEGIRPVIEKHAPRAEEERRLPAAVYDAMLQAGLYRALVPRALGGLERHPVDVYRMWEAVGRIDTAAGWNLALTTASAAAFGPYLSGELLHEMYANGPDVVTAASFYPPGTATRVRGGWRIWQRGRFASGSDRADWYGLTAVEMEDGEPKRDPASGAPATVLAFFPRGEFEVVDTWHTLGMRGTGSNDVVVSEAFAPDYRVTRMTPGLRRRPPFHGPLYGPAIWLAVHGETIASLAAAGAAIDKLVTLGTTKVPQGTVQPLRDRAMAQHHLGKAQGLLTASRAALHTSISAAYHDAEHGAVSMEAKLDCQLAACFAAEACADAVLLVHEAAGTSGVLLETGMDRHLRDALTLTQHISKSPLQYEAVGRHLFGLPHGRYTLDL